MAYWLAYRKGSFEVKERFPCQNSAHRRASSLDEQAQWIEIVPIAESHQHPRLSRALEILAARPA